MNTYTTVIGLIKRIYLHANQATRCGGRDRNWRCGHSRSLERPHANQGVDANHLNAPTKPLREVLAANSYRGHRASVQKVARNSPSVAIAANPPLRMRKYGFSCLQRSDSHGRRTNQRYRQQTHRSGRPHPRSSGVSLTTRKSLTVSMKSMPR